MPKTAQETRLEDRFVSAFEMNVGRTLNGTNGKLHTLRRRAIERFRELGFPTSKHEAWKYTNVGELMRREYRIQLAAEKRALSRTDLSKFEIPDLDAHVVVLENGRFRADLSRIGVLPEDVLIAGLEEATQEHVEVVDRHLGRIAGLEDDVFTALNTAFTLDGLFVYVPKGRILDKPIHVVNVLTAQEDALLQPRHLFVFEEGSQAKLIESCHSLTTAHTLTNAVTEVYVGARAVVETYLVQDEGERASRVDNTHVVQDASSVFTIHTTTFSGAVVRNNLRVVPNAEFCESHLYGLFLPVGRMHVDSHTLVDHARPNCVSNELYKGVLDDESSGVFNGKVLVRRDAQKTNAFQENKSILLTETATMNSKPELEIYADDVKCSHGATTGQLDAEALFYLRSRGIPERLARGMLLHAFVGDVIDAVGIEPLRTLLDEWVTERFGW